MKNLQLTEKELQLLIHILHEKCTYHLNGLTVAEIDKNDLLQAYHENEFEKVDGLLRKVELIWKLGKNLSN